MAEPTIHPPAAAAARPRSIYRGSLALLRNVEKYEKHPYDVEGITASKALLRSKKRQRQRQQSKEIHQQTPLIIVDTPEDLISKAEFVILFFFHPRQPHSLKLRSVVADFCEQQKAKVVCLGLYGGNLELSSEEHQEDATLFLAGTGFLNVPLDDRDTAAQNACSNLIDFLDISHIPSVVVIPTATGRPIMGQEIALGWNITNAAQEEGTDGENAARVDALFQRWHAGSSGLSFSQKVLSKTLGDSSSVCNLM